MVVTADSVKMDSRALATVEKLFWRQIEDGLHPGAALAVYRYGNSVLDLYGGIADTDTGRPVTQDTLFVLYSSTKAITASCIALLLLIHVFAGSCAGISSAAACRSSTMIGCAPASLVPRRD